MAKKKSGAVPKSQGIRYRLDKDGNVRGYEVRYRDPSKRDRYGKPVVRGRTFSTLEQAKAFQTETKQALRKGTYIAPERTKTTWQQVSEEWLSVHEVKIKPRTLNGYRCMLRRWHVRWDHRQIGTLTRGDVRDLIADVRAKGLTEETEHRIFNVASAVFSYAEQEGYIRTSPATAVRKELRSVKRKSFKAYALTKPEAESIIGHISPGRNRLFALLALWTGMRAGELAGLRVRNIDRLRNTVQVEETIQDLNGTLSAGTTKTLGSKGRRVPVPKAVIEEVGRYIDSNRLGLDAFLFAHRAEFFHYQNWRNRHWVPACRKAGFAVEVEERGKKRWKPTVRVHDLRHTFASMRAAEGVPPHVLKEWLGHASITTTMDVYTHVYQDDPRMEAIIERLYSETTPASLALSPSSSQSAQEA